MTRPRQVLLLAAASAVTAPAVVGLASANRERVPPAPSPARAFPVIPGCAPGPFLVLDPRVAPSRRRAVPPASPAPAPARPAPARPAPPAAGAAPGPSARLLGAFSVLRRERTVADTLPASARTVLARSGARFDPAAARLLRTTPRGGRAWIVPVADVDVLACGSTVLALGLPAFVPAPAPRRGPGRRRPARPVLVAPPARPAPVPATPSAGPGLAPPPPSAAPAPPTPAPAPPPTAAPVPATPAPAPPPSAAPVRPATRPAPPTAVPSPRFLRRRAPREGVVVIATGDAPSGGGGALVDLVRARAAASVEPCLGPGGDLIAVSGLVPDGVEEAFLTDADGTAIKTTVTDNAYVFVVPPERRPRRRYVVWTKDGSPRVTPVTRALTALPPGARCDLPTGRHRPLRLSTGSDVFRRG